MFHRRCISGGEADFISLNVVKHISPKAYFQQSIETATPLRGSQ
ncbi:hypothetical protein OU792_02565 [Algoriphagus sp. NF]|nr:hypothetical protein [Algoriphagus sp. NF]MDE0558848.1 hypothetical protein [Algoriphagus sp. NF]